MALIEWSKITSFMALPEKYRQAFERLPQLEERVRVLEAALAGPKCPKCSLPGWHEKSNAVTKGLGAEFGLREITFACLRCGYEKTSAPGDEPHR